MTEASPCVRLRSNLAFRRVVGTATQRYCPLCDEERAETTCPIHQVPTLPPPTKEAPPPITNGCEIAGRYRVEGVLSHGGMGTVLEATQLVIKRPVVVKVLREARPDDRARVRRFYQEARLISAVDHPNIVRIFEFGLDPVYKVPFIAMEKVEGVTLQRIVSKEGPLSERRAARLFAQIVRALIEANRKGVLHRDLKPRNVMARRLPEGGEHITVLDFGLAKFVEDDMPGPPLTAPGRTVGTPGFMSPEQVLGKPLDFRSDLYGLGCMLFVALTGKPPFEGSSALSVMRMQVRERPPELPAVLSDGSPPSPQLRALTERLLAKAPDDRPRRLEEVLDAFDGMCRPKSIIDQATTRVDSKQLRRDATEDEIATRPPESLSADGLATVRLTQSPLHTADEGDLQPPQSRAPLIVVVSLAAAAAAGVVWWLTQAP